MGVEPAPTATPANIVKAGGETGNVGGVRFGHLNLRLSHVAHEGAESLRQGDLTSARMSARCGSQSKGRGAPVPKKTAPS
eukprot:365319-Chlamydomonas_euryale.AAC.22